MVKERLLLMLSVNVQQLRRQFPENRNGCGLVVDVNPISFVRRDFSSDDELAVLSVEAKPVEVVAEFHLEDGFDDRAAFAGTYHFCRCFASRKQAQRIDDNGFAGPSFTGKKVETVFEMKFELIDQSEVSNA